MNAIAAEPLKELGLQLAQIFEIPTVGSQLLGFEGHGLRGQGRRNVGGIPVSS